VRRAVNRLIAAIPAAIVLIVAVSMGIGAALLGYPVWAIPLIAILVLAARLLQFACSASGVEEKVSGGKARGTRWGGPFPDRRVHVPTGLAAHAIVVCISGTRSLLRLRVVSGYHRSLRVLLTVGGGSIGVNSAHVIYWIITQSNCAICETDGALPRVALATRCEAKG